MEDASSDYENIVIRVSDFPEPTLQPDGLWKRSWNLETDGEFDLSAIELPSLVSFVILRIGILIVPEPGSLRVDVVTDDPANPDEVAYTSLLLQRIVRTATSTVKVHGDSDHTILMIAREEPKPE